MYPAFIQLETRLRIAEERLAARDARRAAEARDGAGCPEARVFPRRLNWSRPRT